MVKDDSLYVTTFKEMPFLITKDPSAHQSPT